MNHGSAVGVALTLWLAVAGVAWGGEGAVPALSSDELRARRVQQLIEETRSSRDAARALARRQGWPARVQQGNRVLELIAIRDGRVLVYQTANQDAAISAAVDLVRSTAPYYLSGLGQTVGVWDAGAVRATHQELTGRVFVADGVFQQDHSTHVAGTIGAAGFQTNAMGMAPAVQINSYDWDLDLAEMTARAMATPGQADTLQVSNHSYVNTAGWESIGGYRWYGAWGALESDYFGQYGDDTRAWDQLCYDAPYYLPVKAAGNDRDDRPPAPGTTFEYWVNGQWYSKLYDPETDPYADGWDGGGYDTITATGTAKNVLTVGAVSDAVSGGARNLAYASMTVFSGWGPTDDGRIKPDVVASGISLYSCTAVSDASYAYLSGTSMATASVSGTAALLIEYHNTLFPGQYMRSCMLRGLLIHTADDLGTVGPDYQNGWGLINAKAAADLLRLHQMTPGTRRLVNGLLASTEPLQSYTYNCIPSRPLKVTICWTDPPASALIALDDPSPRLMNDLDLRVIAPDGSTTHLPYVLDKASPSLAATTGDNTVDNVEQVLVPTPVLGVYTVQVSHKGTLTNGQQHYALLVSGTTALITGDFDRDEDVDGVDVLAWEDCASGPAIPPPPDCGQKDLDGDDDVDQADFAVLQHCYGGPEATPPADCFN